MAQVVCGDVAVVSFLSLALLDVVSSWDSFSHCSKPMHTWLLGSYLLIVASRVIHVVGTLSRPAGFEDFILSARHAKATLRALFWFFWLALLPAFILWTVMGSIWLVDVEKRTPQCFPSQMYGWFLVLWQLLCYVWICLHAWLGCTAFVLEWRLRKSEGELRQLEDVDTVARWGEISRLIGDDTEAFVTTPCLAGLAPQKILALPGVSTVGVAGVDERCGEDCPICLCELKHCDAVRTLGACGHTFHRSCIDLWLVRCANCPLCKTEVSSKYSREIHSV